MLTTTILTSLVIMNTSANQVLTVKLGQQNTDVDSGFNGCLDKERVEIKHCLVVLIYVGFLNVIACVMQT